MKEFYNVFRAWDVATTCGLMLVILTVVFVKAMRGTRYKLVILQIVLLFFANAGYFFQNYC